MEQDSVEPGSWVWFPILLVAKVWLPSKEEKECTNRLRRVT